MNVTPDTNESFYIHGATPEEQQRLTNLNDILNKAYMREMPIRLGDQILDLGAGLGQLSLKMAQMAGNHGKVVAIEREPAQIKKALELKKFIYEVDNIEFRRGDALDLPLNAKEWGSFDLVHTRFLLEHIPRPEQVIEQMIKAAKPGGRIILADDDHATFRPTPQPPGFDTLWEAYTRSYDRMGNDPFVGRRLVSLLQRNGLKDIRNTIIFFGGCAGQPSFNSVADNLIGILQGTKDLLLKEQLIEPAMFDHGISGLEWWRCQPDAALWYGVCWAEGVRQKH